MSIKTIKVEIGNNLNAIVKGGENVNARLTFEPRGAKSVTTPEIPGGRGYSFGLEYNTDDLELTIEAGANHVSPPKPLTVTIPLNSNILEIDLQGTHNGVIDIQASFK